MDTLKFKHRLFLLASFAILGLGSCEDRNEDESDDISSAQDSKSYVVRGTIDIFDKYGSPHPSFSVAEFKSAGFEYGDMVDVKIGKDTYFKDVPFLTGFNEVGAFSVCLCDYNALGSDFSLSLFCGNFETYTGSRPGDSLVVTLSKKGGYSDMYKIMHSVYNTNREEYGTDEEFANFREVKTTGVANGVLYRSSNPLNPVYNAVRYAYVDSLARLVGIKTEIDLADTEDKINQYIATDGFASTYCVDLFKNNNVIALGLDAAIYSRGFMDKLKSGLQFMVNHPAPYLIHCNEGKDRCGFVSLLLEALAGGSYQEIADDYMVTFDNFYHVKLGSKECNIRKALSVDRLVWMLANYKNVDKISEVDWDKATPSTVDLQKAAHDYIIDCGLTEDECQKLVDRLTGR